MDTTDKPNLALRWQTEEDGLSLGESWGILAQAVRYNGEEMLGWGWVPMHDPDAPTTTVSFHRDAATALMRSLYSAFAALNDPRDYLNQIGLDWTHGAKPPESGRVGGAQGYGAIQICADWTEPTRYSTFIIYPQDGDTVRAVLGIESVAHIIQLTTQAFEALQWPVPE